MNNYHTNLTDQAVLKRLGLARKLPEKRIQFNVPQAQKSFVISLNEEDFPKRTVFERGEEKFAIFEVPYHQLY